MLLEPAKRLAEKIQAELAPLCDRIEIGGSIRRGRPHVNDIDLVLLPKTNGNSQTGLSEGLGKILDRCARSAKLVKKGDQYMVFELANGFQLDLWCAHHGGLAEPEDLFSEPKELLPNFGVLLFARTGSAMHNVWFAQYCKSVGLHFHPHRGIMHRGQVIAAAEEQDLFDAVKIMYIPPERRER